MARVFLVDDDPDQLELRKAILEIAGHHVRAAASATEASSMIEQDPPKLVIMDLRLPRTEDGLALIRKVRANSPQARIVVLSGWSADLAAWPEQHMVDHVLAKPVRSHQLIQMIAKLAISLICCFLLLLLPFSPLHAQNGSSSSTVPTPFPVPGIDTIAPKAYPFQLDTPAEVIAEIEIEAPGVDWGRPGREGILAVLTLDELSKQHVMVHSAARTRYRVFLGELQPGAHQLKIARHPDYSARGVSLQVQAVTYRQFKPSDADYAVFANAPIIYARPNTVGKFTDIPLLVYCERLENGSLLYSVIFSNEDGGTSTRALMARWGRATDIEYVYQVWPDKEGRPTRATIQTRNHADVPFTGKREGWHPVLSVVTDNNMVDAGPATSAVRYQVAPIITEIHSASREKVMDEYPSTYQISARELERESKLRAFGTVEGNKISAPENYLFVEMRVANRDSRVAVLIRLQDENFFRSSNIGSIDMAIERSGWMRTAIELPPATQPAQVAEIAFQCLAEPKSPAGGVCRIDAISKMFFLNSQQFPDANFWRPRMERMPWTLPAGQLRTLSLR
jgi:CheY-like chemotaxis protein